MSLDLEAIAKSVTKLRAVIPEDAFTAGFSACSALATAS